MEILNILEGFNSFVKEWARGRIGKSTNHDLSPGI